MMSGLNKKILIFSFTLTVIFIQGCSSTGMMTAGHNGKKYWNPGNCKQYRYYNNSDKIYCATNGETNGTVLEPVDQRQLENYYREQEIKKQSSVGSASNTVNCSRFGNFSFNREIKTFSGMVCPMGWVQEF